MEDGQVGGEGVLQAVRVCDTVDAAAPPGCSPVAHSIYVDCVEKFLHLEGKQLVYLLGKTGRFRRLCIPPRYM